MAHRKRRCGRASNLLGPSSPPTPVEATAKEMKPAATSKLPPMGTFRPPKCPKPGDDNDDLPPHPDQINSPRPSPHRQPHQTKSVLKPRFPRLASQTPPKSSRVSFPPTEAKCIITSDPYTPTTIDTQTWFHALYDAGVRFACNNKRKPDPEDHEIKFPISNEEKELDLRLAYAQTTADKERSMSPQFLDREFYKKKCDWRMNRKNLRCGVGGMPRKERTELQRWLESWVERYVLNLLPEPPDLPVGWVRLEDRMGRVYYKNEETGEKSWLVPEKKEVDKGAVGNLGPGQSYAQCLKRFLGVDRRAVMLPLAEGTQAVSER